MGTMIVDDKGTFRLPPHGQHSWDEPSIIRQMALTFDPGDKLNGSLYLCDPSNGGHSIAVSQAVSALRERGLWSSQEPKQVRDEQRGAYEAQLTFVGAHEFAVGDTKLLIARYDHSKFPSNPERFEAWKEALGA